MSSSLEDSTAVVPPLRVLLVEPSLDARLRLEALLARHDYRVWAAPDAVTALERTHEVDPDVVLLELSLPGPDGVELCAELRRITDAYIVVVSVRRSDPDKVAALSAGADDYLTKPYSPDELVARLRAMLRRPRRRSTWLRMRPDERQAVGPIEIDVRQREVTVDHRPVELTKLEFDLLATLASRPRQVFTRAQLLDAVWGGEDLNDPHVVDVHISNLRRKLGGFDDAGGLLRTVRGVGFRLVDDRRPAAAS
jgi:DNA-binding response OmpR family regulator